MVGRAVGHDGLDLADEGHDGGPCRCRRTQGVGRQDRCWAGDDPWRLGARCKRECKGSCGERKNARVDARVGVDEGRWGRDKKHKKLYYMHTQANTEHRA